jgi:hypothetical protein
MAKKVKTSIPIQYFVIRKDAGTVAVRGRGGRFKGRRGPDSNSPYHGPGDTTRARHLIKSWDYNQDGRISPNERGGTIRGRTLKIKASRRARGYERRV